MILELFVALMVISAFFIWLGYKFDTRAFTTVGFLFIFLLSVIVVSNNLQTQTGNIITQNGSTSTVTATYTFYNDTSSHYIGYFMAIASAIGMILSFFERENKPLTVKI